MLIEEEAGKLVNEDDVRAAAIEACEQHGIVFIDEIDKVAKRSRRLRRRRQPRRRAARPAAAGRRLHRQHQVRPGEDRPHPVHRLGRVPPGQAARPDPGNAGPLPDPRRTVARCSKDDFVRILTEPQGRADHAVRRAAEDRGRRRSTFTADAVERLADIAAQVNERQENIGARRLHTVLERLLDTLSYEAPDADGDAVTHRPRLRRRAPGRAGAGSGPVALHPLITFSPRPREHRAACLKDFAIADGMPVARDRPSDRRS